MNRAILRPVIVLLVAAALLAASGCSSWRESLRSDPVTGTVAQKNHVPSKKITTQHCRYIGKVFMCTPVTKTEPEKWNVVLSVKNFDDTTRPWTVTTTKTEYDSVEIGQQVTWDPNTHEFVD